MALVAVVGAAWWPKQLGGLGLRRCRRRHRPASWAPIFFELFPRVMVSTTNSAYNLTVANTASPSYTLKVMTVVAVVFFPWCSLYQGWSLYIFRKRITTRPAGSGAVGTVLVTPW